MKNAGILFSIITCFFIAPARADECNALEAQERAQLEKLNHCEVDGDCVIGCANWMCDFYVHKDWQKSYKNLAGPDCPRVAFERVSPVPLMCENKKCVRKMQ